MTFCNHDVIAIKSRHKLVEIAKIWPAITIYLKRTPPKPPVKPYRSNVAYNYVPVSLALRQYGAQWHHLSIQCVSDTRIPYTFWHAYSKYQFRRVNWCDGWLARAPLIARTSRSIAICVIIFHRRLITKRNKNSNQIALINCITRLTTNTAHRFVSCRRRLEA